MRLRRIQVLTVGPLAAGLAMSGAQAQTPAQAETRPARFAATPSQSWELPDSLREVSGLAVAPDGQIAWSFNTPGMYRARAADGQPTVVSIYKDEQ